MNAFPVSVVVFTSFSMANVLQQNGTRVSYWDVGGDIKYGTFQSTSRINDVSVFELKNLICVIQCLTKYIGNPSHQCKSGWRLYSLTAIHDDYTLSGI
jgi:hypothetical protein